MSAKQLLILLLTGTLSISLVGCNESLEDTPIEKPVEPGNGDDGGGDDGNGGDDGSGDGGDSGEPIENVGTWENKDEDGDGVPDEQDDYPFDSSKTQYPVYIEEEPNDNPSVATPVELGKGFKVQGVISSKTDKGDLYGFDVDDATIVTAVFESEAERFDPQVYVSNSDGRVISKYVISEYKISGKHIVNFQMFEAGRYQLSVMDNNYAGGPDLTYSMVLFHDEDVDAFDDEKERAFGSNLIKNDQDQDGILDGLEYVLLNSSIDIDFDEDGIPNWQDTDSDGDSFSDKVEGIEDLNNDGFPNYIDRDADGNTIDDKLESGDFNNPNDFDDDGIIDHLDLDDDNDGIFDINDLNRLEKAKRFVSSESGSLSPSWIYNLISVDSDPIRSFVRIGDTSELEVVGLPDSADNLVIVYHVNGLVFNSIPRINRKEGNSTYLSLDLPSLKGTGYLQVAYDEIISEELPLEIFDSSNPIITSDQQSFSPGQTITINGENFDSDTTVFFSGTAVKPSISNDSEIVVKVPTQVNSGNYWVVNEAGKSNSINYILQTNLTFTVEEQATKPISAVGSIFPSLAEEVSANKASFTKVGTKAEVVYSFTLNDKGELESYLSSVLAENTNEIEFSYSSTAVSVMVSHLTFFYEAKQISLEEVASIIKNSERFPAFLQEVTTALKQDSGFFSYINPRSASQELLESYAGYFKEQITKSKEKYIGKNNLVNRFNATSLSSLSVNAVTDSSIEPSIVSYPPTNGSWDGFDMTMEATTFADNIRELANKCGEGVESKWYQVLNYDGCVELQNRSQLYLSYRAYEVNPNTGDLGSSALKNPIHEHIDSPYHLDMMSPQSGVFLGIEYWSSDKLIDKCVYKDCLYQIITPGVDGIYGPSPFSLTGSEDYNKAAQQAKKMLTIRTIIDNIIIRFFTILFDAAGLGITDDLLKKPQIVKAVIEAAYKEMPFITTEIEKLATKDNVTGEDWLALTKAIGLEIYNNEIKPIGSDLSKLPNISFGPATVAIMKALDINVPDFRKALAKKLAKKLIPGFGAIDTAYDASQLASAMVDMGKTIKDMAAVPTKLDYVVTWGLTLSDITPRSIEQNGNTKRFTIVGSGMSKLEKWFDENPTVEVIDTKTDTSLTVTFLNVNKEGTELEFMLSDVGQIDAATGPLDVFVTHRGDTAKLPYQILVGSDLSITAITPNKPQANQELIISGIGFSEKLSDNKVIFKNNSGQELQATVIQASNESLTVIVPEGIQTGVITVEINNELSNEYPFKGPSELLITFGDNGNLNDDVYKLSVNDDVIYDNSTPKRTVGPIRVSLEEGTHKVQLTGIRADDGIGTYYIEFAGNVSSVSGDAQSGRDLCPEVVKTYSIVVDSSENSSTLNTVTSSNRSLILQSESITSAVECSSVTN